MPPLTLEKVILIAIIIGLGAAIVANVPARSGPNYQRSAINNLTWKAIGNNWNIGNVWKKASTESETGYQFLEQTLTPYAAINGPFTLPKG